MDLQLLPAGDAGAMVNQAILTADRPLADVLFGVDNTFLSRALEADLFEPYASSELAAVPAELQLDPEQRVTPMDVGHVCLNLDRAAFEEGGLPRPETLQDLTDPALAGTLVVQNPATSSPGLSFLLATVATFGEDGWADYWTALRDNDVTVASGWEEAYYGHFSGAGGGEGELPIVVSYASSPVAEVLYGADPDAEVSPTVALEAGCFEQIEFAGILRGTEQPELAEALIDYLLSAEVQAELPMAMFVLSGPLGRGPARGLRAARAGADRSGQPGPGAHRRQARGLDQRVDRYRPALTRRWALVLAVPPLAFLGLFFLWPVANILALGVAPDGQLQLGSVLRTWSRPFVLDTVLFTLALAGLSTLLTLLLGLPPAWVFARFSFPGKSVARALTVVPFVLPTVVVGSAFLALLGPRSPLNELLTVLFGESFPQVRLDGSVAAILIAHVFYNIAVIIRLVGGMWATSIRVPRKPRACWGPRPGAPSARSPGPCCGRPSSPRPRSSSSSP